MVFLTASAPLGFIGSSSYGKQSRRINLINMPWSHDTVLCVILNVGFQGHRKADAHTQKIVLRNNVGKKYAFLS